MGVAVGLVIGGGNIVRGSQLAKMGMDRVGADYMGMLGTVINALALQDVLEQQGRRDARDDGHPHGGARRAVHPAPRAAALREGAHGHLCRRYRQSVLFDRHRGGAARDPDEGRRHHQGDERRRRLLGRPEEGPDGEVLRDDQLPRRDARGARRDGPDRDHAVQGEQAPAHRAQHPQDTAPSRARSRGERVGTLVQ